MKKLIYLLFAGLTIGCNSSQTETSVANENQNDKLVTLTEQQIANTTIISGKLSGGDMTTILKLNGTIEAGPQNRMSITMPMGGYIKNSSLIAGSKVSKGQILFQMEDPEYIQMQQDYLTAKSSLKYLELEIERQTNLNASKAGSDKVLQQTQMEYTNQKILFNALNEKLKIINIEGASLTEKNMSRSINIQSPINGYISVVNFNNGKYVSPSDIILEIINKDNLTLQIQAFEKDLDKLKVGQQVIAFNNNSNKKYECKVEVISQNFNTERTASVTCKFENSTSDLFPGMYMNAEIAVDNINAFSIPESAIITFEGKSYVFLVQPNHQYLMHEVKTGIASNGSIELLNYNEIGNSDVVIDGAYTLLMALKNKSEE